MRTHLKALLRDGVIVRLKNKRFGTPREMNLTIGTLWCTKSGNGFVVPDRENERDTFVPSRCIGNALHGDKVVVRIDHSFRGRKEGKIIKILSRKGKNVVGFVKTYRNILFLVPEDERIPHQFIISNPDRKGLKEGSLVAARITRFPEDGKEPVCSVVQLFSGLSTVESIIRFIEYKHNLPVRFKKAIEDEGHNIGEDISTEGRLDLRTMQHVTIDGDQAMDFDDAVYVEKKRSGYTLYVSIADVSHYVSPTSSIDREACDRGTSIYFPGKVLPMLPKALSNVVCSLNPGKDRLTVTVMLTFNKTGDIMDTSFHKSIIKSAGRLTYAEVENVVTGKRKGVREEVKTLLPMLKRMKELAGILSKKREERGSLDFDLPEPEVLLDIEGGVRDILRAERLFSHRIIEEFMIAANEAVARFLFERKIPTLYRVHEPPDKEKLRDLENLLGTLSINFKRPVNDPKTLSSILESVKGKEFEFLVNRVLLRSMKQARYSPFNKGHFGLVSGCYLHFTSPIRRYPDLVCHRALKSVLDGKPVGGDEKELEKTAHHLSDRERLVMEAERELEDRIRVLFMKDRVGEKYEGIITHVASYGFYVEIFEVFVEGVVLLSELHDDYYLFQEDRYRLFGRRTRKTFRIGDRIMVEVVFADVEKNRLHFIPV